jgi:3-deoxy-D-manno-octulosonate 8-phosphate phosphatase (KDO 8-P phosphatase)
MKLFHDLINKKAKLAVIGLGYVGMPIAVANAVAQVKKEARYVTAARGGDGAVREAIEFLLNARLDGKNPADFWTAATGPARI